jgi:actin-like ATPase involved in cell morphogenesis
VLLGNHEVPVVELLAAILRAVARAATEAVGFLPAAVLTYPAAWGNLRRQTLQAAAAQAGWHQIRLVPEPVAAARYFTDVMRRPVPPGATIAVFDFGGGTLDVALVRRDGAGFTVVGWGGAEDLGGLDIDAALVGHLGRQLQRDQPEVWRQISQPEREIDRRHRRQFWEDVRSAKEMLSRAAVAPIAVPGVNLSLHVTREELEELARPLIRRSVTEMVSTVQRSRLAVADLSAVFLVGGASRIPLVAQLLHTELGIAPTVLEQPELPVAEGALADLVAATTAARPAPTRTAPPQRVAATMGPPMVVPTSGIPVSASPAMRTPVSAIPVSPMTGPVMAYPPPAPPVLRPRTKGWHPALVVLVIFAVIGSCVGGSAYFAFSLAKPSSTFQDLAEVQTIPAAMAPDAFTAAFLTDKKAHTVAQVGRQVEVSTLDLATKTVKRQRVGDAARWSQAFLMDDFVVALAEPEKGRRQLVGVDNVDGKVWNTVVGADGVLLRGDVSVFTDSAQALLWLDRQTNQMSYISSATGKAYSHTRAIPANWRLLNPADRTVVAVLVTAGGAVWEVGSDQPRKIMSGVADPSLVAPLHTADAVTATPQEEYTVSYVESGVAGTPFHGPANRRPVWLGGCRLNSKICVIDQIGTDPSTREFAMYSTRGGDPDWRAPVPYADPGRLPEFLGQYGDSYVIVATLKDKVPGAVVLSSYGMQVGTYPGRVVGVDTNRALLVTGDSGSAPVPVTLTGLDLNSKLETRLGTVTIRRPGCASNTTSVICPGTKDFTLWRFAK